MIKNHHGVWVFDPYLALVGETSINNLDCQVFAVARVNGNMLSLFSQSMLGSGQSCRMFIPRGDDWNQPAANMCQFPHQCFVCCSPKDAPPTFVTCNKPTPARSHPKVPFSDGLSFQLKQKLNKIVGSFSRWECTVFIDTIQFFPLGLQSVIRSLRSASNWRTRQCQKRRKFVQCETAKKGS